MADGLRFEIDPPSHGWAAVRLTATGVAVSFAASHTPRDSIRELASGAARTLAGAPDLVVVWNTEPVEYEFRFVTANGRTRLEVYEFPDARRRRRGIQIPITEYEGKTLDVAFAFWRGLQRLQHAVLADQFLAEWGGPFPAGEVARLGEELRRRGEELTG
jgi:hypothetical protein